MMTEAITHDLARASALHRQGRHGEAIAMFRQVLSKQPHLADAWYELGYLLKIEGAYHEALQAYANAIEQGVDRAEEAHLNRALIYSDHLRRDDAAEAELQAALKCAPHYVPALLNRGNLHEERGQRDQALACYDQILALTADRKHPYQDLAAEALARSVRLRPVNGVADPVFQRLTDTAADAVRYGNQVRANVLFAMADAYDRLDRVDLAFEAFAKANRCLRRMGGRAYDRVHAAQLTDAMIQAFAAPAGKSQDDAPVATLSPVFICGMFRSGSTLIEQVLGAHPLVTAGGESNFLLRLAANRLAPFPQSIATLAPGWEDRFSAEYLSQLAQLFPTAKPGSIITDKRPDNYLLIGFIKRLFPRAKIVHTTRHPVANGLSIFQQHLNPVVASYSTDLGNIGHHYGEYRRLMAHWKTLFPDSILDFDYDAFVREPQPKLRVLLDFLGLDWHQDCLNFHNMQSTVKTASYWQVRQPLHTRATVRWLDYAAYLEPLRAALLEAGVDIN